MLEKGSLQKAIYKLSRKAKQAFCKFIPCLLDGISGDAFYKGLLDNRYK